MSMEEKFNEIIRESLPEKVGAEANHELSNAAKKQAWTIVKGIAQLKLMELDE